MRAERPAIADVDLAAPRGQITALLGPNGSGKSTVLRVAAGLIQPAKGGVWVGGRDARTLGRTARARAVAFLPQGEVAPAGFRVREVVAMGRAPYQDAWLRERDEDRDVVTEVLGACDLVPLAARRVDELSGGERRRVALARALAQRPRLLLLDEPEAFLDVRHRAELWRVLRGVVAGGEVGCVVAMHDIDSAAHVASRVVLLRGGRVLAAGRPADVMTRELLGAAFDVNVDVTVHAPTGRSVFVVG